jgi:SAM-dependent methyltransferase
MSEASSSKRRRLVQRLVRRFRLQGLVFRWRERRMAAGPHHAGTAPDGKPMPPALLRVMVCGTANPDYFLQSGQDTIAEFDAALRATGGGLAEARAVLDLGCGCGRLARWAPVEPRRLTGIDIEAKLVRWCADHLPGRWETVRLGAPLPLPDGAFDVIYACSVITHLRLDTARAWLGEVARVLESGGRALLTFHDERHPQAEAVGAELAREGWAVRFDSLEGSNHLASFVTAERLAELAGPGLEVVQVTPSDATVCKQAIAVLRKRA